MAKAPCSKNESIDGVPVAVKEPESEAAVLERMFGQITDVTVMSYWKWEFVLHVETSKDYTLRLTVGGSADDIYRYNPFETLWSEHTDANITNVEQI